MAEEQMHRKALREVKDTSFMRGPMEKSFCFLVDSLDSPLRLSEKK